ncbi:MAG: Endoglucanase precursor [Fibrobacterota bacterium]|jgi:hypothetical protein
MASTNRPGLLALLQMGLFCVCTAQAVAAKTEVPLFLLSGQSNMVGLGTTSGSLTAAQKQFFPIDNIKVYVDAEGDATKVMKRWNSLSPILGSTTSQFGPELFFGKVLADSFPGRKFAFIKVARSGTYLGKATEWLPPSSNNGKGGTYYAAMMGSIDAALKAFHSAFDTTLYTPKWAGFLWLQGEFDAMDATLSNQYETNLNNLIKDIRSKAGVADLPVVLPMIDAQSMWTNYSKIWAADVAMTKKLTRVDTVSTKGLPTDNIHYKTEGMVTIGERCAARWIKMKFPTSSVSMPFTGFDQRIHLQPNSVRYDLSGRRIGNPSAHFSPRLGATAGRDVGDVLWIEAPTRNQ